MERYDNPIVNSKEYSFLFGLSITVRRDYSSIMSLVLKPENVGLITVDDIKTRVEELMALSGRKRLDAEDVDKLMDDVKKSIENGVSLSDFSNQKNINRSRVRLPLINI